MYVVVLLFSRVLPVFACTSVCVYVDVSVAISSFRFRYASRQVSIAKIAIARHRLPSRRVMLLIVFIVR